MGENLLKEKHSGGLAGNFEHEKTFVQLKNFYYWPRMRMDVKKFINGCRISPAHKGEKTKYMVVSTIVKYQRGRGTR
jgi:hypothetical protein